MNIGAAIFKILGDDSTLLGLLGGVKKIYPLRAPQSETFPYVVYQKNSVSANDSKDGASTLDVVRVQFDFYHDNFDLNYEISEQARTVLDKYRGTIGGISVDSCNYLTENEGWEDEDDIYRISVDYSFRIKRTGSISGGNGSSHTTIWTTQKFTNQTSTSITVSVADLPTSDFDLYLEIYRDGILMIHGVNYTIIGNVITPSFAFMGENILVKFKPS